MRLHGKVIREGEIMSRPYSQAQNKATQKYIKNNYDEIKIRVPKGTKDRYRLIAEAEGKSLNQFIIDCIEEKM